MKSLSKEQIKDRLIKHAAKFWDIDEIELEYSFDPIISLIYDAFAEELERVSQSIKSSRTRITERLVDLLTPEILTLAKPAHAIMHALPVENKATLREHAQFFYRKRERRTPTSKSNQTQDLFFGATDHYHLNNCSVQYLVTRTRASRVENLRYEEVFGFSTHYKKPRMDSDVWIGIQPHDTVKDIDQLMLYFNTNLGSQRDFFLEHLSMTRWYVNDSEINIKAGYNVNTDEINYYKNYIVENISSKLKFYENYVNAFYSKYFVTIDEAISFKENAVTYPKEFEEFLNEEALEEFSEKLLWIKVSFPSVITQDILENVYVYANCFPVVNKKLIEKNQRIQKYLNILPLNPEDGFFLDVDSIFGDDGTIYYTKDRETGPGENQRKAYLRYGGVSRFDERNASELLHFILDVLKEDSVAFSTIGGDFINTNIAELKQTISRIEQRIEQRSFVKNKIPYLILDSNPNDKTRTAIVFVNYWITHGGFANKIHPYTALQQYEGSKFKHKSLVFITGTLGGEDEPSASEKIYAYREHTLSRGRIVTRQDIVNHCFSHFKNSITEVHIKKGIEVIPYGPVGYTPTIDIYITKNEETEYEEADWSYLRENLLVSLKTQSTSVLPFRVYYADTAQ